MFEMDDYAGLSEDGCQVAQLVELIARHHVLKHREHSIPGCEVPKDLVAEINRRFAALSDKGRAAVAGLKSGQGSQDKSWQVWLAQHLERYPADAPDLFFLQEHFGGDGLSIGRYVYERFGIFDRPWRMHHRW